MLYGQPATGLVKACGRQSKDKDDKTASRYEKQDKKDGAIKIFMKDNSFSFFRSISLL